MWPFISCIVKFIDLRDISALMRTKGTLLLVYLARLHIVLRRPCVAAISGLRSGMA